MLPPEIMPEHAVRSIGVVSNFSQNNVMVANQNAIILPCNADTIKEEVALTFANSGLMERVVVLDSVLYHPDSTRTHILSRVETNALCQELGVDMLYSIDYACLIYTTTEKSVPQPINAYLCSRIYTPDKDSIEGANAMNKESLDYWVNNTEELERLIPQIPSLLAQSASKPYLPTWKERERIFYYDRLCYDLREAKVYVNEGYWEEAATHWRKLANSKLRSHRFASAFNMALYYEMTDSIDQGIASLNLATQEAVKMDRQGNDIQLIDTTLITQYRGVLLKRKKEITKIEEYFKNQSEKSIKP